MWQNNRAERDKSHFESRKYISAWQKRLFSLSLLALFFFPLSLFSLNLSCCPLHSGVHCHSAFGPLCIKKGNFYLQRVHKSILKKGLSKAVLSGKNTSIHNDHMLAHNLYCLTHPWTVLSDTFHVTHVNLLNEWHSALLASVHSEAVGWKMHCWVNQGDLMMSNSKADMLFTLSLSEQWFPTWRSGNLTGVVGWICQKYGLLFIFSHFLLFLLNNSSVFCTSLMHV